ncbi:polysaccharide deacetylase family protein [Rhodoferax aquaticus]|uniref:Chitin deacetylase n=1 Tax=Rhodoferax aquaticus TaxID=2527691 RepID=A0A515EL83_9BURK|nr:polysaccharide deacetylase family protein [Rhodoferax aquaticus]QDL53404.1 chitin deacetylase [Rhodoferax aquaticus]
MVPALVLKRWRQGQRWVADATMRRMLPLHKHAGVVSFSFDDAPHTACVKGREILERHGCAGTWYIAGGLTDQLEMGRLCHSAIDVQSLARGGHHIACHTFTHQPCDQLSRSQMAQVLARNAQYFNDLGLPRATDHFSFPLGAYDLGSKHLASLTFQSSRITRGGVQVGQADLNGLWAEKLYAHTMRTERLQDLVRTTAQERGWLIFYTHEVEAQPGPWGCTPELLDLAVRAALQAGCQVLPVDQAIAYWSKD